MLRQERKDMMTSSLLALMQAMAMILEQKEKPLVFGELRCGSMAMAC